MGNNQNDNNNINNIHDERKFIWIDEKIESPENKSLYRNLFEKYGRKCKKCNNIDEGFNFFKEKDNFFKDMIIIISGKIFNDFYKVLKENLATINFSPTIIIYTSVKNKEKLIDQLKMNNIYYDNDLFDKKLIFAQPLEIKNFINNIFEEENELTFEIVDNNEQLIIPCYYTFLLEEVSITDIYYFNDYLLKKYKPKSDYEIGLPNKDVQNKKIIELINQINYKKLPKEILIKYWLRIYSLQSEFFKDINKSLRCTNKFYKAKY